MMKDSQLDPRALSIPDASAYSSLSRSRLYELMRDGSIPSVQIGGRRLIMRQAIDEFFNRLAEAA